MTTASPLPTKLTRHAAISIPNYHMQNGYAPNGTYLYAGTQLNGLTLQQIVISRVVWNQGIGLKGVTELYLRAVRGEGDSPLFKGVSRKAEKGYTCSLPRVRPAQRAQRLSHTNLMQS